MTEITLYNTRTRTKEPFAPIDPNNVRMYVCGPTVYDRAHIGNARPVVVFDTLFRLLRHTYGEDHVTYVRNITDVEDKINARAAESGRSIKDITDETTRWYHEDMAAVGALPPTSEPRATAYIAEMVAMIASLVARGHAYEAEGHVLFAVASYPDYGKFAHRSLDEMQAGARVEVAPYKRDPMDFVLWKPSDAATPGWDSPWGRGRPGWHIECSAMSEALLGTSFDIHGGGIDLMFPHHENEIAQSLCAHPGSTFANVWMHNGFLNVEGEKMSKSLGNFFTVHDLLEKGIPGQVIRLVLLSTHYRQPIDWTELRVREATALLYGWEKLLRDAARVGLTPASDAQPGAEVVAALRDDLNTPLALKAIRDLVTEVRMNGPRASDALGALQPSFELLGISPTDFQADAIGQSVDRAFATVERIVELVTLRDEARAARDFRRADAIRDALLAAGVKVMDRSGADTGWERGPDFDPAKLAGIDP